MGHMGTTSTIVISQGGYTKEREEWKRREKVHERVGTSRRICGMDRRRRWRGGGERGGGGGEHSIRWRRCCFSPIGRRQRPALIHRIKAKRAAAAAVS